AFTFRLEVADSAGGKAAANFSINIIKPLAITTAAALATGSAGSRYSQSFTATGGVTPYTWSLSGTLPAGVTFSGTGVLSGTPTQVGAFPIAVQVTDSSGTSASANYSLQVVSGLAIATPPVLPAATSGVPYNFALQPAGGSPPYSWTVTAGALPG